MGLKPDSNGEIRCRCGAILAHIERDPPLFLVFTAGLMRLPRRRDPPSGLVRIGLPQGARRGHHPPLHRSPPYRGWSILDLPPSYPLRTDLRWGFEVYCPNCGEKGEIHTWEFPPGVLH